jgi:hypothetical protein
MKPFSRLLIEYRVFPRIFAVLYIIMVKESLVWYLELASPTTEQTAFVGTIVATSAAYFKFYVESGPKISDIKLDKHED